MVSVVLLGKPGSGKGTLSLNLKEAFPDKVVHLSSGELIREAAQAEPALAAQIEGGNLLTDEKMLEIFKKAFDAESKTGNFDGKLIILDGIPRNAKQVPLMKKYVGKIDWLLYMVLDDNQIILDRLAKRGRADDKPSVIEKRLKIYNANLKDILKEFPDELVLKVDVSGSSETVKRKVIDVFKSKGIL
ncbi:MAG: hypothetical protein MHPSP_002272 [Paramarteilia canceri]